MWLLTSSLTTKEILSSIRFLHETELERWLKDPCSVTLGGVNAPARRIRTLKEVEAVVVLVVVEEETRQSPVHGGLS